MTKTLGYARISSSDGQDLASQKAVLEEHGAAVVFAEVGNGSKLSGRDQLETAVRLLDAGDTLLAINADRIARDTADLLTVAKRVVERGATLRILNPPISFDGSDIMAEAMLTLFGMIGRIEKHFIRERQRRGIEAAKRKGTVYKGRPASIDVGCVRGLKNEGLGATEIAKRLKIGRASVYRLLSDNSDAASA
jgi:DNA invertase Pin-like site-specific DNA recombinase